jgi:hypothetical protein
VSQQQAIERWLADSAAPRSFLLTGEPGSGKTAIAARLWQISRGEAPQPSASVKAKTVSAAYFCAAGDRRWINPANLATSLLLQLAARYPAFTTALIGQGDSNRVHIEIKQTIDTVTGTAVGMLVEGLNIAAEEAFGHVVCEPLEAL